MKTLILVSLAVAAYGQSIVIRVTQADGTVEVAKVSGIPAAAAIDTLQQFMATQKVCDTATPPVCTASYPTVADLLKSHSLALLAQLAPQFPSAATKADVAEIQSKVAALEAKRKALFDAAKAEK